MKKEGRGEKEGCVTFRPASWVQIGGTLRVSFTTWDQGDNCAIKKKYGHWWWDLRMEKNFPV